MFRFHFGCEPHPFVSRASFDLVRFCKSSLKNPDFVLSFYQKCRNNCCQSDRDSFAKFSTLRFCYLTAIVRLTHQCTQTVQKSRAENLSQIVHNQSKSAQNEYIQAFEAVDTLFKPMLGCLQNRRAFVSFVFFFCHKFSAYRIKDASPQLRLTVAELLGPGVES